MRALLALLLLPLPAFALSPAAQEFMRIAKKLEPVHCEERKLRNQILMAEVEGHDAAALRERFAALGREPATARLEKRLAELEPRVRQSRDPQDLESLSRQQREAYYRCEY